MYGSGAALLLSEEIEVCFRALQEQHPDGTAVGSAFSTFPTRRQPCSCVYGLLAILDAPCWSSRLNSSLYQLKYRVPVQNLTGCEAPRRDLSHWHTAKTVFSLSH